MIPRVNDIHNAIYESSKWFGVPFNLMYKMHVDQGMELVLGHGVKWGQILYVVLWAFLQYIPSFQTTLMALQDH
jgi:hypothetical protein